MLYDKERWEPKPTVVLDPWRQALLDADWNDQPGRTKTEVILALEKVAKAP